MKRKERERGSAVSFENPTVRDDGEATAIGADVVTPLGRLSVGFSLTGESRQVFRVLAAAGVGVLQELARERNEKKG